MDNVALGKQGEIFVMRKLLDNGWNFPKEYNQTMEGLDWVFEKNGRIIKVQIKTSKKLKSFSLQGKRSFNYLIFTDLVDIYPIPIECLKVSDKLTKTHKKLKNNLNLLNKSKISLLAEINDCGVHFSELDNISQFFH